MKTHTTSHALRSLIEELDTLVSKGCKGLQPVKACPRAAVFGMAKSGEQGFTVAFTRNCAYVVHDSLGVFRIQH